MWRSLRPHLAYSSQGRQAPPAPTASTVRSRQPPRHFGGHEERGPTRTGPPNKFAVPLYR